MLCVHISARNPDGSGTNGKRVEENTYSNEEKGRQRNVVNRQLSGSACGENQEHCRLQAQEESRKSFCTEGAEMGSLQSRAEAPHLQRNWRSGRAEGGTQNNRGKRTGAGSNKKQALPPAAPLTPSSQLNQPKTQRL